MGALANEELGLVQTIKIMTKIMEIRGQTLPVSTVNGKGLFFFFFYGVKLFFHFVSLMEKLYF